MAPPLTFRHACELVQRDSTDTELIDKLDHLLSFVLLITPLALGASSPVSPAAVALISAKGEATKVGKWLAKRLLTREIEKNIDRRQERLIAAHVVISYAAFFEVLSDRLNRVAKELNVDLDRMAIVQDATRDAAPGVEDDVSKSEVTIPLPHPGEGFVVHVDRMRDLYTTLAKAVQAVITNTEQWSSADEKTRDKAIAAMSEKLIGAAITRYKARYAELAERYPEFYIWASLDLADHALTGIRKLSAEVRDAISLISPRQTFDVGFERLETLIESLPASIARNTTDLTLRQLQNGYEAAVACPVIQEKPFASLGTPELQFPTAEQIFVPQAFKVLRYGGTERLEDPATWRLAPTRDDLGVFLVSFLSSPYSETSPLIILGHPGSGKSLLTKILAARLGLKSHTVLRVELRDVKADVDVASQIEEQIKLSVNRNIDWALIADQVGAAAGVIILDGYDELLQASGRVHSGYLLKVKQFQQNELAVRRRPIRAIVTSRVTLIDRAIVPKDCTILKLEEFDEPRQRKWMTVWNSVNERYFASSGAQPFSIPARNQAVEELARQPLLLLMLAIYESDGNPLRRGRKLDRTALYDSLIQRFVERERSKSDAFRDADKVSRAKELDREVERLGIPAIGMFNRRSLSILESQLNADLRFFNALPVMPSAGEERSLSGAALLLGSFFFVHESKAAAKRSGADGNEVDVAFEFLHNTFGEFLAADFLLRRVMAECRNFSAYRANPDLAGELTRKLSAPDGLPRSWFGGLVYTPLFSRPVVGQMLREWMPKRVAAAGLKADDVRRDLKELVDSQLRLVLQGGVIPNVVLSREGSAVADLPVLGHLAVYTLNLITLAAILIPDGYECDERHVGTHPDGARPWDRLTQLWRSWFSRDNLQGIVGALQTVRSGEIVTVRYNAESVFVPHGEVGAVMAFGEALADPVLEGLARFVDGFAALDAHSIRVAEDTLQAERVTITGAALLARSFALRYELRRYDHVEEIAIAYDHAIDNGNFVSPAVVAEIVQHVHSEGGDHARLAPERIAARSEHTQFQAFVAAVEVGELRQVMEFYRPSFVRAMAMRPLCAFAAMIVTALDVDLAGDVIGILAERLRGHPSVEVIVACLRLAELAGDRSVTQYALEQVMRRPPSFVASLAAAFLTRVYRVHLLRGFGRDAYSWRLATDPVVLDLRVLVSIRQYLKKHAPTIGGVLAREMELPPEQIFIEVERSDAAPARVKRRSASQSTARRSRK